MSYDPCRHPTLGPWCALVRAIRRGCGGNACDWVRRALWLAVAVVVLSASWLMLTAAP